VLTFDFIISKNSLLFMFHFYFISIFASLTDFETHGSFQFMTFQLTSWASDHPIQIQRVRREEDATRRPPRRKCDLGRLSVPEDHDPLLAMNWCPTDKLSVQVNNTTQYCHLDVFHHNHTSNLYRHDTRKHITVELVGAAKVEFCVLIQ